MSDSYSIAKDSGSKRATVDKVKLKLGDDPVSLNKGQVERLEAMGVKLTKHTSTGGSN